MVLIFWSRLRPPAQPTWPESQSRRFSPRQCQEARGRRASQAELLTSAQGSRRRVLLPLALASPALDRASRLSSDRPLVKVTEKLGQGRELIPWDFRSHLSPPGSHSCPFPIPEAGWLGNAGPPLTWDCPAR